MVLGLSGSSLSPTQTHGSEVTVDTSEFGVNHDSSIVDEHVTALLEP
jgi:hypothetical protein